MKNIIIFIYLFSINCISQETAIEDIVNGNPKEYKQTYFKAKKVNNKYVKGTYLYDETFVLNRYNEFEKQTLIPLEKWETPQNIYNSKNQKIEIQNFNESSEIVNKTKLKYNSENLLFTEELFDETGILKSISTNEYLNKKIIKKVTKDLNNEYENKEQIENRTYSYDLNGNLVNKLFKSSDQEYLDEYKYDEKNHLIESFTNQKYPLKSNGTIITQKREVIKCDKYNWTEIFLENFKYIDYQLKSNDSDIFFIERIFKY